MSAWRRPTSSPRTRTTPALAGRIPPTVFSSVLLPDPLGPTIATSSPGTRVREVGCRRVVAPTTTSMPCASSRASSADGDGTGDATSACTAPHVSQNFQSGWITTPQLVQNAPVLIAGVSLQRSAYTQNPVGTVRLAAS